MRYLILLLLAFPVQAEIPDGLIEYSLGMAAITLIKEKDKQEHYYAGYVLGTAGTLSKNAYVGFGIGCGAGLGKEIMDHNEEDNKFSWEDLGFTCLGAAISSHATGRIQIYYKDRPMIIYKQEF